MLKGLRQKQVKTKALAVRHRGRDESAEGSPNQCFLCATGEKVGHLVDEGDGNDELN